MGGKTPCVGGGNGCGWNAEMPLSDSKNRGDAYIRALVPHATRRLKRGLGGGLQVLVEPLSAGGGKYFDGRYRFPPGRSGKNKEYRIGPYGKGFGQISLKEAREEWDRIKTWSRENNRPPSDLKKDLKEEQAKPTLHTFQEA